MAAMIGLRIIFTQDFLSERNTGCIPEGRQSCVQTRLKQGREHYCPIELLAKDLFPLFP